MTREDCRIQIPVGIPISTAATDAEFVEIPFEHQSVRSTCPVSDGTLRWLP